jgi:hypothetical protein
LPTGLPMPFGFLKRFKPRNFRLLMCIIGLFCGLFYFNTDVNQRALWQYHITRFVVSFINNPLNHKTAIIVSLSALVIFCTVKILNSFIKLKKAY